jgi:hypothetical protein
MNQDVEHNWSIVKNIVKLMQHKIKLESKENMKEIHGLMMNAKTQLD